MRGGGNPRQDLRLLPGLLEAAREREGTCLVVPSNQENTSSRGRSDGHKNKSNTSVVKKMILAVMG